MPELGPGGRWAITRDIKADPGGCMAIIDREVYREPCMEHNPGIPVYTREELALIKKIPNNADMFRAVQKFKRVFPKCRVIRSRLTEQQ